MPSTFPIPKRKNFDPTPLLKLLQNRELFWGCPTPRICNQFLECRREWAFQLHSPRLAIPKTTTPSHRMEGMACPFLYSPLQNGAWIESLQSQSGMLNNSGCGAKKGKEKKVPELAGRELKRFPTSCIVLLFSMYSNSTH